MSGTSRGGALVLHITNAPTPYRLPQYREIARLLTAEGCRFHAHFLGNRRRDRSWILSDDLFRGIDCSFSDTHGKGRSAEALETVRRMEPAVVVLAWAMDATALRILLHCMMRRIPCLVYTGENAHTAPHNRFAMLRERFRVPFYRFATGFIAYGSSSREYLLEHGVPAGKISVAINVVDTAFFRERVEEFRASGRAAAERDRYRTADGAAFDCHLLFVGYDVEHKGLPHLLDAFSRSRRNIALHIIGPDRDSPALRERLREPGLKGRVFLHGYRQQEELPLFYATADILVFPSIYEVFGLVMVEAAAAGLPIIASKFAGGTADVVVDGAGGVVVDPYDPERFARAIDELGGDPDRRAAMSKAAAEHAARNLTLTLSAEGYRDAVLRALGRGRRAAEKVHRTIERR